MVQTGNNSQSLVQNPLGNCSCLTLTRKPLLDSLINGHKKVQDGSSAKKKAARMSGLFSLAACHAATPILLNAGTGEAKSVLDGFTEFQIVVLLYTRDGMVNLLLRVH